MARKETTFKMNIDSGNAVKDIKKIDQELGGLNNDFVEVSTSISEMEDKLYSMSLAGDTTSKEFKELQAQTAKYKKIVIETDRSIDALAEQGRGLSSALSLAEGTVAGFQAFTGVTALMGNENEDLLKTITKLQAAQGLFNSIEIIKQQIQNNSIKITQAQNLITQTFTKTTENGTRALKGWKVALAATGIGALVIGITLLIQNWDKLRVAIGFASEAQQLYSDVSAKALDAIGKELSASDKLSRVLENETISREDKVKAVKDLQAQYPNLLSNIDAEESSINDVSNALALNTKLLRLNAEQKAIAELRSEEYKIQLQAQVNAQTKTNQSLVSLGLGLYSAEAAQIAHTAEQKTAIVESEKQVQSYDKLDASLQKRIDSLVAEGAVITDNTEKNVKAAGAVSQVAQAQQKSRDEAMKAQLDAIAFREEVLDMIAQAEEEYLTTSTQKEINTVNEKYFTLISRAEEYGQETITLREAQAAELKAIDDRIIAERETAEQQKNARLAAAQREAIQLRRSIERESLEGDIELAIEQFNAKRLALQENEVLAFEEKLILSQELEETELAALDAIKQKWKQKELDDNAKAQAEKAAQFKEYTSSVAQGLGALSALNEAVTATQLNNARGNAVEEEKIRKKSFERNKKLQIVTAVINGVQAVQSALASPFPLNIGLAVLNGALAVANVAKIASTKYEGGGGGASAISSGASSAGAAASSFSVADTSSDQTNLNQDGTQAAGQPQQPPIYVSVTEINEKSGGLEAIENRSTY